MEMKNAIFFMVALLALFESCSCAVEQSATLAAQSNIERENSSSSVIPQAQVASGTNSNWSSSSRSNMVLAHGDSRLAKMYSYSHASSHSRYGINEATYRVFHFNSMFQTYSHNSVVTQMLRLYSMMLESLAEHVFSGALSSSNFNNWWKPIADACHDAYENERGAIIYQERAYKEGRWLFCGWIDTARTFLPFSGLMRLCVPLGTTGLDEIARFPRPFRDYIPSGSKEYMRRLAGMKWVVRDGSSSDSGSDSDSDNGGSGSTSGSSERYPPPCSERRDSDDEGDCVPYQVVDLFGSSAYEENCLRNTGSSNCHALCCLSVYITSGFCQKF